MLSLHQHGFGNTLAPMGTALTETQVRLLGRLLGEDGHVVLMLDGDKAGRAATMKDISLLMLTQAQLSDVASLSQRDIDVRVAKLPDGKIPIRWPIAMRLPFCAVSPKRSRRLTTCSMKCWPAAESRQPDRTRKDHFAYDSAFGVAAQ